MHDASVAAFRGGFRSLEGLLAKAGEFVAAGHMAQADLLEARLAPDMDPFRRQVQHASDTAKACAMRLAGRSVPRFEDSESTLAELQARVASTGLLLDTVSEAELAGSEGRTLKMNLRRRWITLDGRAYLLEFALPNFYFHVAAAYAILRHLGVPLGKADFLPDLMRRRAAVPAARAKAPAGHPLS